ncbi:3-oxoacyl-ACP synthase III family protein [Candidatus Soleaferrea massiliensis]|uniref:3-oxoacyl-ACP synthase III family protein n=1 Tax=Candidatus Soleaferrea massiliensis TaxID=1470354 RepID=UPI00058C1908|nr:beta-ketoacyl-ACP synthase III [Candidatus Soleaferrea massiliensis]
MGISILSTGCFLPEKIVTNDDLATFLDTSDEWITTRTGIKTRHIAVGETTSTMGAKAAAQALERSGLSPDEIDLVICATVSPDVCCPMVSANIKKALQIESAATFDINVNCSSFIYAIAIASSMMQTCGYRNALIVGSDTNSQIIDWSDRSTCVLFGDGAGAAILTKDDRRGILSSHLDCIIDQDNMLYCANKIDPTPFSDHAVQGADTKVSMHGSGVMRFAIHAFHDAVEIVTQKAGVKLEDIQLIFPHQANIRILYSAAKKMGIDMDKFYVDIDKVANTSCASIPIALDLAATEGKLKRGDLIMLIAFGGGLSSGAMLLEW